MVRREPHLEDDGATLAATPRGYDRRAHRRRQHEEAAHHTSTGYRGGDRNEAWDDGYDDDVYDQHTMDAAPYGVIDRILAAPARVALTTVSLIAFAVIGVNAAYLQPGAHPAPMLSTRDAPAAAPLPDRATNTAVQPSQRALIAAPAPSVPPARITETASIGPTAAPDRAGDDIASLLQQPRFQPPVPMPRTAAVGAQTRRAAAPAAQPTPQPTTPAAPAPRAVETSAVTDPIGALLAPVIAPNPTAGTNQPLPQAPLPQAGSQSEPSAQTQPVIAAVQAILADMGYAPGSIDGVMGPSTEEAIRRFQLRRALSPDGQISNELLREIERVTGTRISAS